MSLGSRRYRGPGSKRQRGIVLILFVVGALTIIAMAGLALDLGLAYLTKTRLQNALDAAALEGAKSLNLDFNTATAKTAAGSAFDLHMSGVTRTVQVSATLSPFTDTILPILPSGGFVRVSVAAMPVPLNLVRVLPGVGDSLNLSGSAVAGPLPEGGELCGAIPIGVCGDPLSLDEDCDDGTCFGLPGVPVVPGVPWVPGIPFQEMQIKGGGGPGGSFGPGNYGLLNLSSTGHTKQELAGGGDSCFDSGGTVDAKPGVSGGQTQQGLNTRFGIYGGGLDQATYPPDVVTANPGPPITWPNLIPIVPDYATYITWLSTNQDNPPPTGVPQRRVALVAVINCDGFPNGNSTSIPVLGAACIFLTRQMNNNNGYIYATLTGEPCGVSSGEPGVPGPGSIIVLFPG